MPEEAGLINLAIEKGSSRAEAQREMLGYDYAQLGAELARRWNLSTAFVDAIAQQLDPLPRTGQQGGRADPARRLRLLRLACGGTGPGHHRPLPQAPGRPAGLDPATLADQLEQLHEQGNAPG